MKKIKALLIISMMMLMITGCGKSETTDYIDPSDGVSKLELSSEAQTSIVDYNTTVLKTYTSIDDEKALKKSAEKLLDNNIMRINRVLEFDRKDDGSIYFRIDDTNYSYYHFTIDAKGNVSDIVLEEDATEASSGDAEK